MLHPVCYTCTEYLFLKHLLKDVNTYWIELKVNMAFLCLYCETHICMGSGDLDSVKPTNKEDQSVCHRKCFLYADVT